MVYSVAIQYQSTLESSCLTAHVFSFSDRRVRRGLEKQEIVGQMMTRSSTNNKLIYKYEQLAFTPRTTLPA